MEISVVIRNKNEADSLEFLLSVLQNKFQNDINEVIVLDNLSTDNSQEVSEKFGARFVTVREFSYGGSANIAASEAANEIVVIFSAHSYPVSHDFFKLILERFQSGDSKLAGIRCIHNNSDFKVYLSGIQSADSPNLGGLNFAGSAFSKLIWEKHPFNENVRTFEDKEWTLRMLKMGYKIEVAPCIFNYYIKRSQKQLFFRFKNDTIGSFQIFNKKVSYSYIFKSFFAFFIFGISDLISAIFYNFRRLLFLIAVKIRGFEAYRIR